MLIALWIVVGAIATFVIAFVAARVHALYSLWRLTVEMERIAERVKQRQADMRLARDMDKQVAALESMRTAGYCSDPDPAKRGLNREQIEDEYRFAVDA